MQLGNDSQEFKNALNKVHELKQGTGRESEEFVSHFYYVCISYFTTLMFSKTPKVARMA